MDDTLRIVLVAAVALAIWYFVSRSRWNLRIVVREGNIDVKGQAVAAKAVLIRNFFRQEFADLPRAKVEGFWNGHYLRLRCSRDLSVGQRQRIRSYLMQIL